VEAVPPGPGDRLVEDPEPLGPVLARPLVVLELAVVEGEADRVGAEARQPGEVGLGDEALEEAAQEGLGALLAELVAEGAAELLVGAGEAGDEVF